MKGCLVIVVILMLAMLVCAMSSGGADIPDDESIQYFGFIERTGGCYIGANGIYVEGWDTSHRHSYYAAKFVRGHLCGANPGWWGGWEYEVVGEQTDIPVIAVWPFVLLK